MAKSKGWGWKGLRISLNRKVEGGPKGPEDLTKSGRLQDVRLLWRTWVRFTGKRSLLS